MHVDLRQLGEAEARRFGKMEIYAMLERFCRRYGHILDDCWYVRLSCCYYRQLQSERRLSSLVMC